MLDLNPHEQRHSYQTRVLLEDFWGRAFQAHTSRGRLALLRRMTETTLTADPFKPERSTVERRQHFRKRKARGAFRLQGWCWVCQQETPDHRHHIIPVQRGGPNIRKNVVNLCTGCHSDVHRRKADDNG